MKLYEIDERLEALLLQATNRETGEIDEAVWPEIEALELAREKKLLDLACYQMGELRESEAVKAQADALARRAKIHKNRAERLKQFLATQVPQGQKLRDPRAQIGWRKSTAVEVIDEKTLPSCFLRRPPPVPDKKLIGDTLKSGGKVPGAELQERQNLQVKP